MKSGYILLIFILLFGSIDYWAMHEFFRHSDYDEYSWIMYFELIWVLLGLGMCFHKKWALSIFRIMLWLWALIILWLGLAVANAAREVDILSGIIFAFKAHWLQFILFAGLLIFMKSDKVKEDFGIVEKKIE